MQSCMNGTWPDRLKIKLQGQAAGGHGTLRKMVCVGGSSAACCAGSCPSSAPSALKGS